MGNSITQAERERRLWARLELRGTCWVWVGPHDKAGYGRVKWHNKNRCVHQVVWELLKGPRPLGLESDHLCRVRDCANPDHIEFVTRRENIARARMARGKDNFNGAKTHCPQGHEYSETNTTIKPDGRRRCKQCHRDEAAARRARMLTCQSR